MKNDNMSNATRTLYRFTSLFASFSMTFKNDAEALAYANEMTDGAQRVQVARFSNSGDWFVWNGEGWIYDPSPATETAFVRNPALA